MTAHLWKIVLVVAMTHLLRELGRRFGPRWGALALGLPCSTAIALVGCGQDLGVAESVTMAGSSLVGLVGASSLPVAFAWAIGRGLGPLRSATAGVAAYLALAGSAAAFAAPAGLDIPLVVVAVLAASGLAAQGPPGRGRPGRVVPSTARTLGLRTLVPVACLSASIMVGRVLGPGGAGLMSAFPAVTLTVLVLTEVESGTHAAIRMARALPMGNLAMVAFLSAFRLGCPALGLAPGVACSYLASILTLAALVVFDSHRGQVGLRPSRRREAGPGFAGPLQPSWPRAGRRFSPLVESFAA